VSPRQAIESYFEALTKGDADRLIGLISTADLFVKIGTDENEIVCGGSNATEYYRHHVASTSDFSIEVDRLDVQERESIAWFFTEQTWHLKWQGNAETLGMRLTGVLEREETDWKFVQIHASIGFPAGDQPNKNTPSH
jgi:hypothetical protein